MSTAADELAGYREQRIAGTIDQGAYFGHVERLGPLIEKAGPPAAPANQQDAAAQLADLQARRVAGTISTREYQSQADRLGPIASGEAPLNFSPTAAAEIDAAMQAPSSPAGYNFNYGMNGPSTPEALAADAGLRESLHKMGVPQSIAAYAHSTVERLAKSLENATPEQRQAHAKGVADQLRERWGDQYAAKVDAIDELVASAPGVLGDMIEGAPWLLADALLLAQLDQLTAHRARKRT